MIGADIHFQLLSSVTVPEISKFPKDSLQKDISTFIGCNSGPEIYSIRRRALFRRGSRKKILRVKFWKLINACLKVGIAFDNAMLFTFSLCGMDSTLIFSSVLKWSKIIGYLESIALSS